MLYEILTASKEHDEAAVRAGLATARPNARIEAIEDKGQEWSIRLVADDEGNPFAKKDDDDEKPKSEDSEKSEKSNDKSDDEDDKGDDKGEKKDKKDNASVDQLRDLVKQLTDTMEEVVKNAEEVASDADGKQQKMEEIHDSVKDHVDGDKPKGDDLGELGLEAPLPADATGLDDVPGGPPAGGPKPPMPPRRPGVPSGKPKPPARPPSGIPTFTNVEIANHPGVDADGNRLALAQVVAALEAQDDLVQYEVVGLVANRDGSYSAKLVKRESE